MGVTDEGFEYDVLRGPDAPPIVLAVKAPDGQHWTEARAIETVGQPFGMRWHGRTLMLRVVAASVNRITRRLELTCR